MESRNLFDATTCEQVMPQTPPAQPAGDPLPRRQLAWTLAGITTLALAIRLWNLAPPAFWTDEMYSIHVALRSFTGALTDPDQTPPLFVGFLHFWIRLFGTSEFAVRLPSVLAGTATAPLAYCVARRYLAQRGSLLAATLVALHYFLVILSQDARAYAFLALLATASMLSLLRLEEHPTWKRAAVHAVVTTLLLYSHAYAVFVVLAQVLYVAWSLDRFSLKHWLLPQAAALLLFSPWLPNLLGGASRVHSGFWLQPVTLKVIFWVPHVVSGGTLAGLVAFALLAWLGVTTGLPLLRRNSSEPKLLLLWAWLACTVVLPILISFTYPIFTARYAVPGAVPLLLLGCRAIASRKAALRKGLSVLLIALLSFQLVFFFTAGQTEDSRQDWRGAVERIESQAANGSVVIVSKGYCDSASDKDVACSYEWYAHRKDITLRPFFFEDRGSSRPVNATNVQEIDAMVADAPEAWLLYSYPSDTQGLAQQRLEAHGWHLAGHWNLKRIELWRFIHA